MDLFFHGQYFCYCLLGMPILSLWGSDSSRSGQSDFPSAGTLSPSPCWGSAPVPASGKPPLDPALRGLLCYSYPALRGDVGVVVLSYFLSLISYLILYHRFIICQALYINILTRFLFLTNHPPRICSLYTKRAPASTDALIIQYPIRKFFLKFSRSLSRRYTVIA